MIHFILFRSEIRYGNWQNAMYYKIEHGGDYTIIASAGPGGNIYPSGSQLVVPDFSHSFSIVPNTGYVIQNVETDNDVDHGPIVIYTFSNVVADHSISATFTPITYTISASAGTGGSITPSGSLVFRLTEVKRSPLRQPPVTLSAMSKLMREPLSL